MQVTNKMIGIESFYIYVDIGQIRLSATCPLYTTGAATCMIIAIYDRLTHSGALTHLAFGPAAYNLRTTEDINKDITDPNSNVVRACETIHEMLNHLSGVGGRQIEGRGQYEIWLGGGSGFMNSNLIPAIKRSFKNIEIIDHRTRVINSETGTVVFSPKNSTIYITDSGPINNKINSNKCTLIKKPDYLGHYNL